jgi:hypothetical protein
MKGTDVMLSHLGDLCVPPMQKYWVTVSVSPVDFMNCSYGTGWDSCHDVRNNKSYKAGALSYLQDGSAIIVSLYKHKPLDSIQWEIPELHFSSERKSNRMLFHYNGDKVFLQARMYPNHKDASFVKQVTDAVMTILNVCLDRRKEDTWTVQRVMDTMDYPSWWNTDSYSKHYRDYDSEHNRTCNFVYYDDITRNDQKKIPIGHRHHCFICCQPYDTNSQFVHNDCVYSSGRKCKYCDRKLNPSSDSVWYGETSNTNGYIYCMDCVCDCEHCGRNITLDDCYEIDGETLCDVCHRDHTEDDGGEDE